MWTSSDLGSKKKRSLILHRPGNLGAWGLGPWNLQVPHEHPSQMQAPVHESAWRKAAHKTPDPSLRDQKAAHGQSCQHPPRASLTASQGTSSPDEYKVSGMVRGAFFLQHFPFETNQVRSDLAFRCCQDFVKDVSAEQLTSPQIWFVPKQIDWQPQILHATGPATWLENHHVFQM